MSDEENTAILQGFTITGGTGSSIRDDQNTFVRLGGGILIYQSSPTSRHNIIAFNESNGLGTYKGGGGICAQNSNAIISNNIIYKNNAQDGGGMILGQNSGSIIRNNIIVYNTNSPAKFGGGGVFIRGTQGRFINNTIAFNHSAIGGGIDLHKSPKTFNIENCIIYGNTTGTTKTQITGLKNIKINNSNIEGGWVGNGNIEESPLFKENTPLILQDSSPCIDKGDMNTANNDWENHDNTGFALHPALGTLRNDMGAYGGNQYKSMPFLHMADPTKVVVDNSQIKNYYAPGIDTVIISSKIVSPEDQAIDVKAVFKSSDRRIVDTIIMVDDGSIRDSIAGDGWYTAAWVPISEKRYSTDITVFLKDYKEIVTFANAFKFTIKEIITGIEDENGIIHNETTLNQNYPNPFNITTTISYSISKPEFTTLKVYDLLGKEIKMLVNEHQTIGTYKIEFDASSLQGGVYFYKMNSGEFSDIKKLLLVK